MSKIERNYDRNPYAALTSEMYRRMAMGLPISGSGSLPSCDVYVVDAMKHRISELERENAELRRRLAEKD